MPTSLLRWCHTPHQFAIYGWLSQPEVPKEATDSLQWRQLLPEAQKPRAQENDSWNQSHLLPKWETESRANSRGDRGPLTTAPRSGLETAGAVATQEPRGKRGGERPFSLRVETEHCWVSAGSGRWCLLLMGRLPHPECWSSRLCSMRVFPSFLLSGAPFPSAPSLNRVEFSVLPE